jgi:alpha-tubulin suppressor-like RCC1 family protein
MSSGVRSLAAGGTNACAVTATGSARCWGSNSNGQLGNPSVGSMSNVPVQVRGLGSGQKSVAVGGGQSACAVSTGGAVKCWGYNHNGQLGNGTDTQSAVPVQVRGLSSGVRTQSQSTYTGCALKTNARVSCWGYVPVGSGITDVPVNLPWFD